MAPIIAGALNNKQRLQAGKCLNTSVYTVCNFTHVYMYVLSL